MMNEDKDRLKRLVKYGFSLVEWDTPSKQDYEDLGTILSLIDNQPSEEEAGNHPFVMGRIIQIQAVSLHGSSNHGEHIQLYALCEDG